MRFYTNVTSIGSKVCVREVDTDRADHSINERVEYSPSLYTPSNKADSPYRTIYNAPLDRHQLSGVSEYWDFRNMYAGVDNYPLYGDVHPSMQFISDEYPGKIEFDFNMIRIFYIDIEVYTHDGKFPKPERADYPVSAISIYDSITKIWYQWGLEYEGCFHGAEGYDPKKRHPTKQIAYAGFDTEEAMLGHFLKWWKKFCPDIITGWNSVTFDIPYLINRINNEFRDLNTNHLSPWSKIKEDTMDSFGKPQQIYNIEGVAHLDYLIQYKKHSFTPQEQYKLAHIAYAEELEEKKMTYDEQAGLHGLYVDDYQKYIDYNVRDTEIVKLLEEKRGILFLIVAAAYRSHCNYEDIISPIRTWDALFYNYLKTKNQFFPPKSAHSKKEQFAGAYVKEPIPGRYDWVVSVDLASLYPSLIRQINVSPETLVTAGDRVINGAMMHKANGTVHDFVHKKVDTSPVKTGHADYSLAANGAIFRRDEQGFLPVLLESLYLERKAEKKKMLQAADRKEKIKENFGHPGHEQADLDQAEKDKLHWHTQQYAKKILLNSAYGALGNQYFRMFDVKLAEAVTLTGQVAIQWIERKLNEYFNVLLNTKDVDYVIYIDTDGLYLNCGPLVKQEMSELSTDEIVKMLDKFFAEFVAKFMTESYQEMFEYMNHREQLMFMDRECIADMGIWSAKKRYMLNVHDNEGVHYAKPKLKVMGYAFIKSDVPEICRKKIFAKGKEDDILDIVVHGTQEQLIEAVAEFKAEFMAYPPEVVAKPSGVNGVEKYRDPRTVYKKGAHPHIRGSIIYNHWHKEKNLIGPVINDGDKIKYLWLHTPNPIFRQPADNVIAFPDFLPRELDLHEYIDYDRAFKNQFLDPLHEVTEVIGWHTEKVANLGSIFERQIALDKAPEAGVECSQDNEVTITEDEGE